MQDIMQMQTKNISFPYILDPLEWSSAGRGIYYFVRGQVPPDSALGRIAALINNGWSIKY